MKQRKLSASGLSYVPPSLIEEHAIESLITPVVLPSPRRTDFLSINTGEESNNNNRKAIVQLGGHTFSLFLASDNELQVMTPRQFRITQVLLPEVQPERKRTLSMTDRPTQEGHWWTFLPVEVKVLIAFSLVLVFSMVGHYVTHF